jgi:hypothetical protein
MAKRKRAWGNRDWQALARLIRKAEAAAKSL